MSQAKVTVRIVAEVNPTESEEKVRFAIGNLVEKPVFTITPALKGSTLNAVAEDREALIKFRNILRSDRIRDAARKQFYRALNQNTINFFLNKQVAFAGHISFAHEATESPLGPINVTFEAENAGSLIEWLTEKPSKE